MTDDSSMPELPKIHMGDDSVPPRDIFIHMAGVDGCNWGIIGVYTPGFFAEGLESIESMFAIPIVEQVGWSTREKADGPRTNHVITRKKTPLEDEVEEHTGCRTEETKPDPSLTFQA